MGEALPLLEKWGCHSSLGFFLLPLQLSFLLQGQFGLLLHLFFALVHVP